MSAESSGSTTTTQYVPYVLQSSRSVFHHLKIPDNTFPYLRWKRTLLCRTVPRALGAYTDLPSQLCLPSIVGGSHLARAHRPRLFPGFRNEKHYQHCPVVEGFQDPSGSRFGGEGQGEEGYEGRQGLRDISTGSL
jgi:hypothetical protein